MDEDVREAIEREGGFGLADLGGQVAAIDGRLEKPLAEPTDGNESHQNSPKGSLSNEFSGDVNEEGLPVNSQGQPLIQPDRQPETEEQCPYTPTTHIDSPMGAAIPDPSPVSCLR